MNIKIKKLHEDALVPKYATPGSACFDLHVVDVDIDLIWPGRTAVFRTGLAFEVPEGWCMKVYSRSGHGFKNDVSLSNCVGIIDSDFRNEVMVKLCNDSNMVFRVADGDRIAQAMLVPIQQVSFSVVDELSTTERGLGGFGSTGK